MNIKTGLCTSTVLVAVASIFAISPASAASAQEAAAPQGGIEDIVVTAQRRAENMQDVPVAVTVANAETLAESGITNVTNLNTLSPSISFRATNMASSTSNIQIRGIGTTGNARTFEGAVGVFIDGVYRTRSGQALSNFLDVESLQILRGPQGTLFGKNTSAGAVLVASAKPSTLDAGVNFETSYANYGTYLVRGALNLPLSDTAAVRIAAVGSGTDGNIRNPNGGFTNKNDDWGVKGQILLQPTDNLTLRLIGDYAKSVGDCCYGTVDYNANTAPTQDYIDILTGLNGLTPPSRDISKREAVVNPYTDNRIKDYGGTLHIDYEVGNGAFRSVTALRRYNVSNEQDADFSGATIMNNLETFNSKFFSQELTYTGEIEGGLNVNYVVGGFFSDEKLNMGRDLWHGSQAQSYWDLVFSGAAAPGVTLAQALGAPDASGFDGKGYFGSERFNGTARSLAFFTHWDFKVSDQFNVIAGARYTNERKTGAAVFRTMNTKDPLVLLGVMPGQPYDQKVTNEALSGTVGLQYKPNDDTMLYATYNRGFKAGGVNLDVNAFGVMNKAAADATAIYKPETIDGFEAGFKLDWMNGFARTNVAVFHNNIKDLQVAQFLGLRFAIVNAPSAKVTGAEIEQTFKLSDNFTLNGGLTWLPKANYGNDAIIGTLANRRFSTAPELAGNASLSGEVPVSEALAVTGRIHVQYTGKVFTNPVTDDTERAFALVDANLGLKSLNANWQIDAFVRNLFNTTYVTSHFNTPLQTGDINAYLGAPRTYGVALRGSF